MHCTQRDVHCLLADGQHHGFPSLCQWRGAWYAAWRTAPTHHIVPPGHITLWCSGDGEDWQPSAAMPTLPQGDLRDPKLVPTPDVLYCLAGTYLPHPWKQTPRLRPQSEANLIQTMLCGTTDGAQWTPWEPYLRPQHWGWSVTSLEDVKLWACAAYVSGDRQEAHDLVLWLGRDLLSMGPHATMYEGGSYETLGDHMTLRYPAGRPSEPVLYCPAPGTLACCVRTGGRMEIGCARDMTSYRDWRWHQATIAENDGQDDPVSLLHPSSVLATDAGWLLAARCVTAATSSTRLYHLIGTTAREVLRLPGGGDCAYPSLAPGPRPGTVLVLWYAQEKRHWWRRQDEGAAMWVATVEVEG